MTSFQPPRASRQSNVGNGRTAAVTALGALLSAVPVGAQTNQVPNPALKRPLVNQPVQKPGAQPQVNSLYNLFGGANNSAGHTPALSPQAQKFLNPTGNAAGGRAPMAPMPNFNAGANRTTTPNFNTNQRPVPTGPAVPARNFPGSPAPVGGHQMQGRNGSIIRTASDGSVLDVRNPNNGMVIHHALDGSRRVMVEKPDRSRAYIPARGVPYVQHPYTFRGQQLDHRTYVFNGQTIHQVYRPYNYHGQNLDVYATSRYFAPNFYQWATSRVATPVNFTWPYTNGAYPWFSHYKGFFTPETSYQSPTLWLTDYVMAATLYVAYLTKNQGSDPAPTNAAPITPDVKQKLADEVGRQVKQEAAEATDNAQNRDPQPGAGSVVQTLSDNQQHTFPVNSDLDLVDSSGRRCTLSDGDLVSVTSGPKADTGTVDAVVLSSKGTTACGRATQVQLALTDVQEMQNHLREAIDQGMANTNAAKQSQSVTPAFAQAAPPADQSATQEIEQQTEIAAAADG